jgi:hypothetical protein
MEVIKDILIEVLENRISFTAGENYKGSEPILDRDKEQLLTEIQERCIRIFGEVTFTVKYISD